MNNVSPVRENRKKLGLTQADLAEVLNRNSKFSITRQDINRMELGGTTPKSRQLEIEALKYLAKQQEELEQAERVLNL